MHILTDDVVLWNFQAKENKFEKQCTQGILSYQLQDFGTVNNDLQLTNRYIFSVKYLFLEFSEL